MSESTSPDQQETLGVVIVNYNAGHHLLETVASVRRQRVDQVVVVDNGSTDGSADRLAVADPEVHLIRSTNRGFGAGNNTGVAAITTDLVLLLNPDTVVHDGAFDTLRATLASDPSIGIVGPRLLNTDGSLYPSARAFPVLSHAVGHAVFGMVWKNNPWTRRYKRLDQDYSNRQSVDWVSGAAMFMRKSTFDSVEGFDESYFLYMEDVDLCWRLRKAGWDIVYEPAAEITHVGGVSSGKKKYFALKEHHKSAIRYNVRTARGMDRIFLPFLIVGLLGRLPIAWLQAFISARRPKS